MKIEKRIIVTTVVLMLLTIATGAAVAIPSVFKIKALTQALFEQQAEIERRYILRNYVKNTLSDIDTAQEQLENIQEAYIREGDELTFIQAMENAANITNVKQQLSLETVNEIELTLWEKEVPLRVKAKGTFTEVNGWLNEVEHLDYYVIFNTMTFNAFRTGGIQDPFGVVDANFSGSVYWLSDDAPYFLEFEPAPTEESVEDAI
ncbi:MAG: hypothetical protein U9Q03_02575 [Patescibacteria group bacterium]|nr:hypothetical protein [Patescibacteria group bacterium]